MTRDAAFTHRSVCARQAMPATIEAERTDALELGVLLELGNELVGDGSRRVVHGGVLAAGIVARSSSNTARASVTAWGIATPSFSKSWCSDQLM